MNHYCPSSHPVEWLQRFWHPVFYHDHRQYVLGNRYLQHEDIPGIGRQRQILSANYVAFRLITLLIGLVVIGIYSVAVSPDSLTLIAVFAYLLFKTDESFCDVLYGVDQRGERMDYIGISQFIRGVIIVLAILAMFPAGLLVTILYDIPHAGRPDVICPDTKAKQAKDLFVECLPIVLEILFLGMIASVARQYYANAYGTEHLGIYAAVATPAVLIQTAARYLFAPALVPLSEKWSDSPRDVFLPFFKKALLVMAVLIVICVALLSLIGPPLLNLVYGQKVEGCFTNVLISTSALALLYYLSDILVLCRDIKGAPISAAAALIITLGTMIPLEAAFDMQGINYVVIIASLAGAILFVLPPFPQQEPCSLEQLQQKAGCPPDSSVWKAASCLYDLLRQIGRPEWSI